MHNHPRSPFRSVAAVLFVAAAACLAGAGCSSGGPFSRLRGMGNEEASKQMTEAELGERLHRIEETFARTAQSATDAIAESDAPPEIVRRAFAWRLHAVQALRTAVLSPDPQAAFLDVWVFLVQQHGYFRGAAARGSYPQAAERILQGVEECQRDIVALGGEFLTAAQLESARKEVETFAAAHSMTDAYARSGNMPTLPPTAGSSKLDWIVSLPMAPFQVFSGIDEGAAAIREFNGVAERFSRRVEKMPQETAWELQLMLHDVENGPTALRTIAAVEEFSAASASLAETADRLPEDVRSVVDDTLGAIDERHAKLDASLVTVKETVERAEGIVRGAEKPLADAAATAKSFGEAGDAWKGTVESFHALAKDLGASADAPAPAETAEPGHPFDIREYEATATAVTGTARELRGLLADVDGDETAARLTKMAKDSAAAARAEGEALVDHVFVRALQLAGVVAVLAVAGVLAVRRWGRGA